MVYPSDGYLNGRRNDYAANFGVLFQRLKQKYYTDSPHSSTNQMEYVEVL